MGDILKEIQNYALRLLTGKMYTKKDLLSKLEDRFSRDEENIVKVIKSLEEQNLINDEEYVRAYLTYELDTNIRGSLGYFQKLYQKGISKELFYKVWQEMSPDEAELASKLLRRNLLRFSMEKDKLKRKEKMIRYLSGRGFDYSVIMRCLEKS